MYYTKRIISRIIVGVGVALVLMLLKKYFVLDTYALTVYTGNMSGQQSNTFVVDNLETAIDYNFNPIFHDTNALGTSGYINFTMSFNKVSGSATAPIVTARGVAVTIGDIAYVCNIGSVQNGNSTFNEVTYSVRCPVNMSGGLHRVYVALNDFQTNDLSSYRVKIGNGVSYEEIENASVQVNVDTSGIISNQTSNTEDIIDSQEELANDIIDNQNQNTQQEIDSQKVCSDITISKDDINLTGKYLTSDGSLSNWARMGVTDYFEIFDNTIDVILPQNTSSSIYQCFYNSNKVLISCLSSVNLSYSFQVPSGSKYARFTIDSNINRPQFSIKTCKNGNQAIADNQKEINNTLNDDSTAQAQANFGTWVDNVQIEDNGLATFVTTPLRLVQAFTTTTCTPLQFDLPFVEETVTIPCMRAVISNSFPTLFALYQLITTGLLSYRIGINIFAKAKGFINPENDRIEVLNL